MSIWRLQFPPKNERKQVDLRFHSSKVEFVFSFFGGNVGLKKSFRFCLTFSFVLKTMPKFWVSISLLDFNLEEKSRNSGWYFSIRIEHEVLIYRIFLEKNIIFHTVIFDFFILVTVVSHDEANQDCIWASDCAAYSSTNLQFFA